MHLEHLPASDPFHALNIGTGLAPEARCQHGEAAFTLHLIGYHCQPQGKADATLDVLAPRCVTAQMVGALAAFITHHEGPDASTQFMDDAREAFRTTLQQLRNLHAQGRDCCEAAFRTSGLEHTCRTPQKDEQP